MDAAFVFGSTGNLSTALGSGWSVEDAFAWAIGTESELTLPLRGDDRPCALRFDIHPAIFPPKINRQRLMVRAGKTVLGSFELTARETIVIQLPVELTRGAERLDLTLIHPDTVRPRDHLAVDDSRRLTLCFHSGSLTDLDQDISRLTPASDQAKLEPVHGLVAGSSTAMRICRVISGVRSLKGRFGLRFLDLSEPLEKVFESLPPETLETLQVCWVELNAGNAATRDRLRQQLPAACAVRTYYAPIVRSLWPFQAPDARAVVEPGRYHPARYPHGDRLAQALLTMNLPDDVLCLMYEVAAEQEPLDLDEIFANDQRRWRVEGKKSDMRLAAFIEYHFGTSQIFIAPDRPGPLLLRHMVEQVLDDGLVRDIVSPDALSAELDTLLDGYLGLQEELPVHKRVADHFNLSWWSPDMKYRWMNNKLTYHDYLLNYIKWTQWRP